MLESKFTLYLNRDEFIKKMIRHTLTKYYKKQKWGDEEKSIDLLFKRDIDIFRSFGYGDQRYTSVFFCIKGSPNKMTGCIFTTGQEITLLSDKGNCKFRESFFLPPQQDNA